MLGMVGIPSYLVIKILVVVGGTEHLTVQEFVVLERRRGGCGREF